MRALRPAARPAAAPPLARRGRAARPPPLAASATPPPPSTPDRGDGLPPLPRLPRTRADWSAGPALHLSADAALAVQLDALAANDAPHRDHGVEVCYRFADIALYTPCHFFGVRTDVGQFERFRYQFGTARFAPLRGLAAWRVVAAFDWQPDEGGARAMRRVAVTPGGGGAGASSPSSSSSSSSSSSPSPPAEDILYDVVLGQRVGGPADGCWFTLSLTRAADGGGGGWSPQVG